MTFCRTYRALHSSTWCWWCSWPASSWRTTRGWSSWSMRSLWQTSMEKLPSLIFRSWSKILFDIIINPIGPEKLWMRKLIQDDFSIFSFSLQNCLVGLTTIFPENCHKHLLNKWIKSLSYKHYKPQQGSMKRFLSFWLTLITGACKSSHFLGTDYANNLTLNTWL